MINVNELKPGITFKHDGNVYILLDSTHSKSGRGQAHVKTKVKNLETGTTKNITFTGGDKVEKAFVETKEVQFLYFDTGKAHFMDMESYEQLELSEEDLKWQKNFLIEGTLVKTKFYEGKVVGLEIPTNITIEVMEAPNAVQGNTATNATKKIKLVTGLEIDAPQFVCPGDKVVVNTESGKYVGRDQN